MPAALRIRAPSLPRAAPQQAAQPVPRPTLVLVGPEGWPPPEPPRRRPLKVLDSHAMQRAALGPAAGPPSVALPALQVGLLSARGTASTMTPANLLFGPEADITQFVVTILDPGTY